MNEPIAKRHTLSALAATAVALLAVAFAIPAMGVGPRDEAGSPATPLPAAIAAPARAGSHVYRTLMLRAAPGELAAVIELIQERMPVWEAASAAGPFLMRHSQGDQWDLLLLFSMGASQAEYHGPAAREARRAAAEASGESDASFRARLLPKIAWREELIVAGPSPQHVASRFDGAGFFHVEIFLAVAGKRAELVRQREMENVYLEGIGREPNLIFTRVGGAPWDCYTIGLYRDIKHFAESADIPAELEERAAVAAGFESSSTIGTYLRDLIAQHHDTLAVAVR